MWRFSTSWTPQACRGWGEEGEARRRPLLPHCRLLFIRSRRFFRSSRLAADEEEERPLPPWVGEWACALCSCWYSSRDSLSCDSLLWSMSVEEATDGLDDSSEEMAGRCRGSSSPLIPWSGRRRETRSQWCVSMCVLEIWLANAAATSV